LFQAILSMGDDVDGLSQIMNQSLPVRLLNRMKQEGPIDNLFLAGAWTFPGGGQSACLMSGNAAAKKILKKTK
jgi:phytoene dehydrogenase-like protein